MCNMGNCCRTLTQMRRPKYKKADRSGLDCQRILRRSTTPSDSFSAPPVCFCEDNDDRDTHECLRVHDVLICIFEYLPFSDRKNVRRTCKLWNEVCSTGSITKGEKLVFRPNCSVPEITELLRNLRFEHIHIEFQNQPVISIPADVWRNCGSKVRGLHFHRCCLDQQILKSVIEHCENLCDINIRESGSPLDCATLDSFVERKIKRERLSSFAIRYANDEYVDVDLLRRIFAVFPRIQNFTTGNAAATPIPNSCGETVPQESLSHLRSLVYLHNSSSSGLHWLRAPMIPVWKLRLRKFETTLNQTTPYVDSLKETLFSFFETQKDLEIINLRTVSGSKMSSPSEAWALFIKQLIFHVLERCPKLREFRLADLSDVRLTGEETGRFFALVAPLKCLVLSKCRFRIQISQSASLARLAVHTLRVDSTESGAEEFKTCILGQCSLKKLRIGKLSDEIFQKILKTQPDLRILVLDDIQDLTSLDGKYRCHNFAERDREPRLSIRELKRLEHLVINERYHYKLTEKIAGEFQFPFLKHLKLDMHSYNMPEKLHHIASNVQALEVLELDTLVLDRWNVIIALGSALKNLRRLSVYNVKKTLPKDLLRLFQKCRNLKYVTQISPDEVFLFNPFTEKISSSCSTDLKFPGIEDILDE